MWTQGKKKARAHGNEPLKLEAKDCRSNSVFSMCKMGVCTRQWNHYGIKLPQMPVASGDRAFVAASGSITHTLCHHVGQRTGTGLALKPSVTCHLMWHSESPVFSEELLRNTASGLAAFIQPTPCTSKLNNQHFLLQL